MVLSLKSNAQLPYSQLDSTKTNLITIDTIKDSKKENILPKLENKEDSDNKSEATYAIGTIAAITLLLFVIFNLRGR